MSKLSEMIATLCPNGVEYKRFSEVCFYIRGVTYGKSQEIRNGEDGWKVLRANNITLSTNSLNYDDVKVISKNVKVKPAQLLRKGDILICAGSGSKEHVGKVAYISEDSDYTFGGFMAVVRAQNADVDTRYLYHVLTRALFINYLKIALNSTTINNLSNSVIGPFEFPLPPLPIQREIVQILDNFANLTAELTAELAKRKKQYEHYRDMLLNFTGGGRYDKFGVESGEFRVEWKRLGEIGRVAMCKRVLKQQTMANGDIPFFKIGTFGKAPDAYISRSLFDELRQSYSYPKKGSILISAAGTIGRTIIFDGEPAYYQDSNIVWLEHDERQVLNKYLYYFYQTNPWQVSIGGTIPRLYNRNIEETKIPLPPLAEQKRIVAILDRFDSLCNSLTEGLPAEIALRKKQYEYYRDKLLNFKEAS